MDLTSMIPNGAGEEQAVEQRLSKEEYAAMKKQQREEVWAEVDAQAQAVFQNGESLKGFLDFMAQCNTQKTPNLLLIYGQNPQATVVKSYDYWKAENRSPKSGVHGYTYMVSTEYEKDGEMRTGYTISKGFDISQMSGKPLEERPQRSMEELIQSVQCGCRSQTICRRASRHSISRNSVPSMCAMAWMRIQRSMQ